MIHLPFRELPAKQQRYLDKKQDEINRKTGLELQFKRADKSWNGQKFSKAGSHFNIVRDILWEMGPPCKTCAYCGRSTGTSIDHIFPKRLFPERTFVWENYLMSCTDCNSNYKRSNFAVFVPAGSANLVEIEAKEGDWSVPPSSDAAFINLREEQPEDYLILDIVGRTFAFVEAHPENTREWWIGNYTVKLLKLNARAELVEEREKAARFFIQMLEKYVSVKNASTVDQLRGLLTDWDPGFSEATILESAKNTFQERIKSQVLKHHQPGVWRELKRQRAQLSKTNHLFQQVPEALDW